MNLNSLQPHLLQLFFRSELIRNQMFYLADITACKTAAVSNLRMVGQNIDFLSRMLNHQLIHIDFIGDFRCHSRLHTDTGTSDECFLREDILKIPGYDVYYQPSTLETKRRYLQNLKKGVEMAEKAGVILGLETMENEFMNTVEKAMKYVTLCGSNYLKVYPDIGNLTNAAVQYQSDVLEDLELGRGNITSMHLKETKPGKYREIPYGTGHVDFEAAIKKAWEMGIRRYVTDFRFHTSP